MFRSRLAVALWALAMSAMAAAQAAPARPATLPDAPSQQRERQVAAVDPPVTTSLTARASAPYVPLTPRQKFHHFLHHTYSPYTFVNAMYNATYAQATGDPRGYGGGMEGWGKRLGAAVAGTESRSFFGTFLLPTLLHQDPRYFAMYKGSKPKRAFHALCRTVVVRADDGHNTFNTSGLLTVAFTESLQNAWMPPGERGAGITFSRMLGALQGDAASYLLREFTPDLQRLFRRFAPKKVKQIEQKLPPEITGMPPKD